jgi:hypothetical protein
VLAQHETEQPVAVEVAKADAAHHVVAALLTRALERESWREPGISLK